MSPKFSVERSIALFLKNRGLGSKSVGREAMTTSSGLSSTATDVSSSGAGMDFSIASSGASLGAGSGAFMGAGFSAFISFGTLGVSSFSSFGVLGFSFSFIRSSIFGAGAPMIISFFSGFSAFISFGTLGASSFSSLGAFGVSFSFIKSSIFGAGSLIIISFFSGFALIFGSSLSGLGLTSALLVNSGLFIFSSTPLAAFGRGSAGIAGSGMGFTETAISGMSILSEEERTILSIPLPRILI